MDIDQIPTLLQIARSQTGRAKARAIAAEALAKVGETWPHNGCAATLSALLRLAGIKVPMILGAGAIANRLGGPYDGRGWKHVPVGAQRPGDVGVTFDTGGNPGADHVYLVIEVVDADEMIIVDNQAPDLHSRWASGKGGKTRTDYFLRATADRPLTAAAALGLLANAFAPMAAASPDDAVAAIAAGSPLIRLQWEGRGKAPRGYVKGMALAYARAHAALKGTGGAAAAAAAMTVPLGNPATDALAWYAERFAGAGMPLDTAEDRLRALFVLLTGLGMRESSGRYCEGRDRAAENTSAATAEAGLFQCSWNLHSAHPCLDEIIRRHTGSTELLDVFREGVTPRAADLENFGKGAGLDYQYLAKTCPAFAVEFAAVGLRNQRRHWGPINARAAEVRRECDRLFADVAAHLDAAGSTTI